MAIQEQGVAFVSPNPWVLTATEPVEEPLYLANGYLGASLDATGGALWGSTGSACYVRGVYDDSGPGKVDRLVAIPCWHRLFYDSPATIISYRRDLNLRTGTLQTDFLLEEQRGMVHVRQTVLISRWDRHQAVIRIEVRPEFHGEIRLRSVLRGPVSGAYEDLRMEAQPAGLALSYTSPTHQIRIAEMLQFESAGWLHHDVCEDGVVSRDFHRIMRPGQRCAVTQLARVAAGPDGADPAAIVRAAAGTYPAIRERHEQAWARLWQTDITIEGDPDVQQFARAALFYLWSSVREGDEWSIAPMGLSSTFYNGHIFWDAELWMYPALLLTQPDMARACVRYRHRTLPQAQARARAGGFRGARFPWEAGFTGQEMTPPGHETRDFQIHVTADVAIGQWWYFLNTRDQNWLRLEGYPVIRACAEYWESRVEYNQQLDRYELSNVVCADEYAAHVDNNAFTNAAVSQALLIAARAAEILGEPAPDSWARIASQMYIPYDDEARIHLEFDGYDGRLTKQADVELLSYPLEFVSKREQIARDLDYYAKVIDPDGPAMSFSVYSIVSAQLGRPEEAYEYFKRGYLPNIRKPFFSFSETPLNDEPFFCTGAGGSLQALLAGFTGLRLREDHFVLSPTLPFQWQSLTLSALYLLGVRTDLDILPDRIRIRRGPKGCEVKLEVSRVEGRLLVVSRVDVAGELHITDTTGRETTACRTPFSPKEAASVSMPATSPIRVQVSTSAGEMLLDVVVELRA